MFIFATHPELRAVELIDRIMSCNHSLGQNDIIKFVYLFHDTISYSIYF
jgi:hypothetical protein